MHEEARSAGLGAAALIRPSIHRPHPDILTQPYLGWVTPNDPQLTAQLTAAS